MASVKLLYTDYTDGTHHEATGADTTVLAKIVLQGEGMVGLDLTDNFITNVKSPVNGGDAVNKDFVDNAVGDVYSYVDTVIDNVKSGFIVKDPVLAASTGNILGYTTDPNPANHKFTQAPNKVDDITPTVGARILVKDQTDKKQNGVYVVSSVGTGSNGVWTRAPDFQTNVKDGFSIFVRQGTTWHDTTWVMVSDGTSGVIQPGTDAMDWKLFSGTNSIIAGLGLVNTNMVFDVGRGPGIKANADNIEVELIPSKPGLGFDVVGVNGKLKWLRDERTLSVNGANDSVVLYGDGLDVATASPYGLIVKTDNTDAGGGAGTAIRVSSAGVTALIANDKGLSTNGTGTAAANGIGIKHDTTTDGSGAGPTLKLSTAGARVALSNVGGLEATGTTGLNSGDGVRVKVDTTTDGSGAGTTLKRSTNGLRVKMASDGGLTTAAGADTVNTAGIKILIPTGSALATDTSGLDLNTPVAPAARGLSVIGGLLDVELAANPGLSKVAGVAGTGGLSVLLSGTTLDKVGGLKVLGVPNLFTINGTATGATVTAANLNQLTNGSVTTLHSHAVSNPTNTTQVYVTDDALKAGDPVYASDIAGHVKLARADSTAASRVIGIAKKDAPAGNTVDVFLAGEGQIDHTVANSFGAGNKIYLANTGGVTTNANGIVSGNYVVCLGYGTANDKIVVQIQQISKRA